MPKLLTENQLYDLLVELLETTTPYKYEQKIRDMLPKNVFVDAAGNAWFKVGDGPETDETLFCCHMDTVGQSPESTVPFYYEGKLFALSKTSTCLGGDDRCGILCLLAMINAEIPGWYLFHVGEEKGTIGAEFAIKNYNFEGFKRAIEFDRRGTTSIITVMMGHLRTCSDEFANALAKQLNAAGTGLEYKIDETGVFTDVTVYQDVVPECTNLSVGYNYEHSNNEQIQVDWLIKQFIPALYTVKWNELPVARDPKADNVIAQECWGTWGKRTSRGWTNCRVVSSSSYSSSKHSKKGMSKEKSSDSTFLDSHVNYYEDEHNLNDKDEDITAIDGLTVFDEEDFFDCCNFCAERNDSIKEYFFDGKFWSLCKDCMEFLEVSGDLNAGKEEKEAAEKKEESEALKKAEAFCKEESVDDSEKTDEPDIIVEVESESSNDNSDTLDCDVP